MKCLMIPVGKIMVFLNSRKGFLFIQSCLLHAPNRFSHYPFFTLSLGKLVVFCWPEGGISFSKHPGLVLEFRKVVSVRLMREKVPRALTDPKPKL